MKILIAPDKFKGSLTAQEACEAIERGLKSYDPSIKTVLMPLADGGEGSLDMVKRYVPVSEQSVLVKDPLGRSIQASYLISEATKTAYIEMSQASGLSLLTEAERNPLYTSTYGTGEIILDALSYGAKHIYLFIGGSATNDMGIGMASALGYEFLDRDGDEVPSVGLSMAFIMKIRKVLPFKKGKVKFYAICDVENPLFGKNGAAHVYAGQKGAGKYAIRILDKGLRKLSKRCKKYLEKDVARTPGAGAAGGLGAGIMAFLDGELLSGITFMKDVADFENALKDVDLVITGEGKIDDQSLQGKVISGVVTAAKQAGLAVEALCGQSSIASANDIGLDGIHDLMSHCGDEHKAMSDAAVQLEALARKLAPQWIEKYGR